MQIGAITAKTAQRRARNLLAMDKLKLKVSVIV
jgi:hypothetical protein